MLRNLMLAGVVAGLAATASAQCSSLTATNVSGDVTLSLDGTAPMAFAFVAVGDTTGNTSIDLGPIGTLDLGLAAPFVPVPMGMTDTDGDVELSFTIGDQVPAGDYYAQAVTLAFSFAPGAGPSVDLCASNVATITVN